MLRIFWRVTGHALDGYVVLHQNAVLQHGDTSGSEQRAVVRKARRVVNDVIDLPFAGRAATVDQGRILAVNGASLAVEVRGVGVGIQDLDFITALDDNTAVSPALTLAFDFLRRGPFDMQLAIAKRLLGMDVTGMVHRGDAVFDFPARRPVFVIEPLREVIAVEEDNGIRRRADRDRFLAVRPERRRAEGERGEQPVEKPDNKVLAKRAALSKKATVWRWRGKRVERPGANWRRARQGSIFFVS